MVVVVVVVVVAVAVVVAVVVAGILVGNQGAYRIRASFRLAEAGTWRIVTLLVENAVFLFMGFQLWPIVGAVAAGDELLGTLDPRARYAVEARFGLIDGERKSFREVGEDLGVTAEAARRLVSRAVAGLREDAERILAA